MRASLCVSNTSKDFPSFSKDKQLNMALICFPSILNDNLDHFTLEAIVFMEEEGLEAESTDLSVNFSAKYKGFL